MKALQEIALQLKVLTLITMDDYCVKCLNNPKFDPKYNIFIFDIQKDIHENSVSAMKDYVEFLNNK